MKTADLVNILAAGAAPVRPGAARRRLVLAGLAGGGAALVAVILWLGLRPLDLAVAAGSFWMKAAYTVALSAAGLLLTARLSQPGRRAGAAPWLAATAVAALAAVAAAQLLGAAPGQRMALWLGSSGQVCPWRILVLAAPVYAAVALALRSLAPTRLAAAGAAAGLLAGAIAATAYGLHCQETAAPFVVTFYTLGIGLSTAVGAVLGRWLLRW